MGSGASKTKEGRGTADLLEGARQPHPPSAAPAGSFRSLHNCSFANQATKPPEEKLLIIKGYLEA